VSGANNAGENCWNLELSVLFGWVFEGASYNVEKVPNAIPVLFMEKAK